LPYAWVQSIPGDGVLDEQIDEIKSVADYINSSHCPGYYGSVKSANHITHYGDYGDDSDDSVNTNNSDRSDNSVNLA